MEKRKQEDPSQFRPYLHPQPPTKQQSKALLQLNQVDRTFSQYK